MAYEEGYVIMSQPTTGELAVRVDDHDRRFDRNNKDHVEFRKSIDGIKNRLPVWATMLLAISAGVIGALLRGDL